MKFKIVFGFIILILTVLLILGVEYFMNSTDTKKVCFNENCFGVEIANDLIGKSRGLMFRENLEKNEGMLFVYDREGVYNFWMKNTLIPLDMIWINSEKEIVYIKENAQPCKTEICESFGPKESAKYVLEINAGISKEINLKVGDRVEFKL